MQLCRCLTKHVNQKSKQQRHLDQFCRCYNMYIVAVDLGNLYVHRSSILSHLVGLIMQLAAMSTNCWLARRYRGPRDLS